MAYTTINKSSEYFDTLLWTGDNSSTKNITGLNFQPDLSFKKERNAAFSIGNMWYDSVRGLGQDKHLNSASTAVEGSGNDDLYGYYTGFISGGFSVTAGSSGSDYVNNSSYNYVAWNWKANGAGVTNTAGTISSTVSANPTSGFSIVSYTSPNSSSDQTVGHGLGVTPSFIITKNLDNAFNWDIHHKSLSSGNGLLFTTDVPRAGVFGSMTSTTFGTKTSYTHNSTHRYIAYCFAEVKGFSKFGSYVGNGSTDGTFIYTGFKPAFVIVKASSTAGQWSICDNRRGTANTANGEFLFAEIPDALNAAVNNWDFVSNGFKARANYAAHNTSGVTYVYMAFAEQTLVGTNNVPATAR